MSLKFWVKGKLVGLYQVQQTVLIAWKGTRFYIYSLFRKEEPDFHKVVQFVWNTDTISGSLQLGEFKPRVVIITPRAEGWMEKGVP